MPALGKEIERQLTSDEVALKEIQGYIDRAERQAETQQPQLTRPQQAVPPASSSSQALNGVGVAGIQPLATKKNITLPMNQTEVENGLKRNVIEGVRWLSEWCVLMIKKYPGRVFYTPQITSK